MSIEINQNPYWKGLDLKTHTGGAFSDNVMNKVYSSYVSGTITIYFKMPKPNDNTQTINFSTVITGFAGSCSLYDLVSTSTLFIDMDHS